MLGKTLEQSHRPTGPGTRHSGRALSAPLACAIFRRRYDRRTVSGNGTGFASGTAHRRYWMVCFGCLGAGARPRELPAKDPPFQPVTDALGISHQELPRLRATRVPRTPLEAFTTPVMRCRASFRRGANISRGGAPINRVAEVEFTLAGRRRWI